MRFKHLFFTALASIVFFACTSEVSKSDVNIVFLHHSTGKILWNGTQPSLFDKLWGKIAPESARKGDKNGLMPQLIKEHNNKFNTNYAIQEQSFPKAEPYGWNNFPYDYYNIWVKNAGETPYMEEPTLEMLTKQYQVIVFKHCFPVCYINTQSESASIDSNVKTLENYKLQYMALKEKMNEFGQTKFIVFTGAAQVKANISETSAQRAADFFTWVKTEWDTPNDNIFVWDLFALQTEGGLFLKDEYATGVNDSHPNTVFSQKAGPLLVNRILDVIENNGEKTSLTGEMK